MIVVDASVAAKWFLPEARAEAASALLATDYVLVAPDLIRLEVAGVFLRALRRGELSATDAEEADRTLCDALRLVPATDVLDAAFEIAGRHGGALYDAVYVAVARSLEAEVATDDEGLAEVARRAGVGVATIADGPPPS